MSGLKEQESNKSKVNMNKAFKGSQVGKAIESRLVKSLFYGFVVASIGALFAQSVLAAAATAKFDIGAGIEGGTKPLIDAVKAHWGKGVLLAGGASALIGEGDMRQKAIRAGIGCFASGGVVLALIAMLT